MIAGIDYSRLGPPPNKVDHVAGKFVDDYGNDTHRPVQLQHGVSAGDPTEDGESPYSQACNLTRAPEGTGPDLVAKDQQNSDKAARKAKNQRRKERRQLEKEESAKQERERAEARAKRQMEQRRRQEERQHQQQDAVFRKFQQQWDEQRWDEQRLGNQDQTKGSQHRVDITPAVPVIPIIPIIPAAEVRRVGTPLGQVDQARTQELQYKAVTETLNRWDEAADQAKAAYERATARAPHLLATYQTACDFTLARPWFGEAPAWDSRRVFPPSQPYGYAPASQDGDHFHHPHPYPYGGGNLVGVNNNYRYRSSRPRRSSGRDQNTRMNTGSGAAPGLVSRSPNMSEGVANYIVQDPESFYNRVPNNLAHSKARSTDRGVFSRPLARGNSRTDRLGSSSASKN
ncbi:hypothetical protein B0J18DRAFT_411396 [Chaetomium sp. MPI-SDFR-AT-0129]|nr:hypothetical protein B0J18DRAFT_411396 [Chaetomium sp. MPI-SDFR-AT-0129]